MPKTPRQPETAYYSAVERFLKKRFRCYVTAQNTGTKYGRVDVVGIRDFGGELGGEAELIAVEVKAGRQPFNTATGQAYGYSVYAERCYLADFRTSRPAFTLAEIDVASKLGVGLLAIGRRGTVQEVLSSPQHQPMITMRGQLTEKLGYSTCTVCGSLFRRGDSVNFRRHVRQSVAKAFEEDKGLIYWLAEVNRRRRPRSEYLYVRRYVCPDCVYNLYGEFLEGKE
jgi:hypothetical protein